MKRKHLFITVLLCLSFILSAKAELDNQITYQWANQREVCYFEKDGLIGLMQANGKMLLEPRFTKVSPFYFNIAVVEENGLLGAITSEGEILVDPVQQWDSLYFPITANDNVMHHEVLEYEKDRKYGFVTLDGNIHEAVWDYISPFVNGTAIVKSNGQYNLINTQGMLLCPEWYAKINFDYEQLSSTFLAQDNQGKYGALGPAGEVLLSFEWDSIKKADDCYIVEKEKKKGILNSNGELRTSLNWDNISSLYVENGDPLIAQKDGKYGFIDLDGNEVIPFLWDKVYAFSQGIAKVEKDHLYGYINKGGEYIIPLQKMNSYDYFDSDDTVRFVDIEDPDQWGYMDRNGNVLCKVNYQYYTGVPIKQEGLNVVTENGKAGYMEINGEMAIPFQWEYAYGFSEGFAFVSDGKAYAMINKNGDFITDYIWTMPGSFEKYDEAILAKVSIQTDTGFAEGYINQEGKPICGIKLYQ